MLALRAGRRGHVGLHQRLHHLQTGPDGQGEQALAHRAGDLGHRHAHPLGHDELVAGGRVDLLVLVLLGHGGPLLVVSWRTPNTYLTAGAGGGPPPQLLRDPGQPPTGALPKPPMEADPPRRFSFRWVYDEEEAATSANSLLVTFELVPSGAGTLLRFTETGFEEKGWEAAVLEEHYRQHVTGWDYFLPA